MALILHLLAADVAANAGDDYLPAAYAADGFIHCSGDDATMLVVANAYYRDRTEPMVVWTIDTDHLASEVRWEAPAPPDGSAPADSSPSIRFPHVYGPIDRRAVIATRGVRRDEGGAFVGYDGPR
jgi:uncharacterized protein (DUF952 family)